MNLIELRKYRFLKMAIFDWILTIIVTFILVYYFNLSLRKWLLAIPILTIIFHKLFNIETQMVNYFDNNILFSIFVIFLFLCI